MKILEMIQKAFAKRKHVAHKRTEHSEELTEKYFELLREKEMRLKAEGVGPEKLFHELFAETEEEREIWQ